MSDLNQTQMSRFSGLPNKQAMIKLSGWLDCSESELMNEIFRDSEHVIDVLMNIASTKIQEYQAKQETYLKRQEIQSNQRENELKKMDQINRRLTQKMYEAEGEIYRLREDLNQTKQSHKDIENALLILKQEKDIGLTYIEKLEKQLIEIDKEKQVLRRQNERIQKENNEIQIQIVRLREKLNQTQDKCEKKQQLIQQIKGQNMNLKDQIKKLQSQIGLCNNQNKALKQDLEHSLAILNHQHQSTVSPHRFRSDILSNRSRSKQTNQLKQNHEHMYIERSRQLVLTQSSKEHLELINETKCEQNLSKIDSKFNKINIKEETSGSFTEKKKSENARNRFVSKWDSQIKKSLSQRNINITQAKICFDSSINFERSKASHSQTSFRCKPQEFQNQIASNPWDNITFQELRKSLEGSYNIQANYEQEIQEYQYQIKYLKEKIHQANLQFIKERIEANQCKEDIVTIRQQCQKYKQIIKAQTKKIIEREREKMNKYIFLLESEMKLMIPTLKDRSNKLKMQSINFNITIAKKNRRVNTIGPFLSILSSEKIKLNYCICSNNISLTIKVQNNQPNVKQEQNFRDSDQGILKQQEIHKINNQFVESQLKVLSAEKKSCDQIDFLINHSSTNNVESQLEKQTKKQKNNRSNVDQNVLTQDNQILKFENRYQVDHLVETQHHQILENQNKNNNLVSQVHKEKQNINQNLQLNKIQKVQSTSIKFDTLIQISNLDLSQKQKLNLQKYLRRQRIVLTFERKYIFQMPTQIQGITFLLSTTRISSQFSKVEDNYPETFLLSRAQLFSLTSARRISFARSPLIMERNNFVLGNCQVLLRPCGQLKIYRAGKEVKKTIGDIEDGLWSINMMASFKYTISRENKKNSKKKCYL